MEILNSFSIFLKINLLGNSFGLNTNIFETNVINLSVVFYVLISLGGDALRALLKNRKEIILKNILEVDQKTIQAQEKLKKAKDQFDLAEKKIKSLRQQTTVLIEEEKKEKLKRVEKGNELLKKFKQETMKREKKNFFLRFSKKLLFLSFYLTDELLKIQIKKMNVSKRERFHLKINIFHAVLFKNYK